MAAKKRHQVGQSGARHSVGKVIPAKRWENRRTGATASVYGAVPWTGGAGNRQEDWEMVEKGWTISWPDGTVGIGRTPFESKDAAEKWTEEHPHFRGMGGY